MTRSRTVSPIMTAPYDDQHTKAYDMQAPKMIYTDMGVSREPEGFSFGCVERGVVGHVQLDSEGFWWFVPAMDKPLVLSTTLLERITKKLRELNGAV